MSLTDTLAGSPVRQALRRVGDLIRALEARPRGR